MSATLKLIRHAIVDIDGKAYPLGSLTQAFETTLASDLPFERVFAVAPVTAVKIFDIANDLASFSFLWIETDLDVLLQFTTNATEYDVKELVGSGVANTYGAPFILFSDDTQRADGAINVFTGTADTIEKIYAYNEDATDTARVHIFAAV